MRDLSAALVFQRNNYLLYIRLFLQKIKSGFSAEVINMSEDILWNKFAESGRVEDYLIYSESRDAANDNTGRDRS